VPYSQVAWWTDGNGTYRQDCSGYVSMAWHLDENVNYWTGNLHLVSRPIHGDQLKAGDILLSSRDHTVIFAGWSDRAQRTFSLYEQARPGLVARYVTGASLASYLSQGFVPYRYNGILDAGDPQLLPLSLSKPAPLLPADGLVQTPYGWGPYGTHVPEETWTPPSPVAFTVGHPESKAPLIAAGCAALLACAFPMTAITAPVRRALRPRRT
jgi:hypothetical protein